METGFTGQNGKAPIPKRLQKWGTCSRSKAGDVIGVTSISKKETGWKLTIASLAPLAERIGTTISNSCIAIAMIKKTAAESSSTTRGTPDKSQTIEEPDDANVS